MLLVLHLERMVTREGRNVLMRYATIYLFQTLLKVFTVKGFTDFILSAPHNYFHLVYNRKTGGNFAEKKMQRINIIPRMRKVSDVYLLCGCLIVFICLSLWCYGLDVYLIVSVPKFTYLLCSYSSIRNVKFWMADLIWPRLVKRYLEAYAKY